MLRPLLLVASFGSLLALVGCSGAADGDPGESEAAQTKRADAGPSHEPTCTTSTGYILTFTSYDSATMTVSFEGRKQTLTGDTVAFRKRRYQDDLLVIDVYKGLGEYDAHIFDRARSENLGHCTLQ